MKGPVTGAVMSIRVLSLPLKEDQSRSAINLLPVIAVHRSIVLLPRVG